MEDKKAAKPRKGIKKKHKTVKPARQADESQSSLADELRADHDFMSILTVRLHLSARFQRSHFAHTARVWTVHRAVALRICTATTHGSGVTHRGGAPTLIPPAKSAPYVIGIPALEPIQQ
jgi:hypothetical protein